MDLLEDLKKLLLNFNFVMIYIIHKMLAFLKNCWNCLKDFHSKLMENLSLEVENIKDTRNLFRLEKELNCTGIKDIRKFLRLEKDTKAIKDRILRDIKHIFEYEEGNYYKPVRVGNFWSNNYVDYKSNSDRNKTASVEEYLNTIRPYLKDIKNNLKKFDLWKNQLTIVINFIFSTYNYEEHVMDSKSDNIEIMINDESDDVIKELFDSRKNNY